MRIISMRLLPDSDRTGNLARFDLEIGRDLTVHGITLHRTVDGELRAYSPSSHRRERVVSFNLSRVSQITNAAFAAYSVLTAANDDA